MSDGDLLQKFQGESIVGKKYTIHKAIHESPNCHIYTIVFEKDGQQIIRVVKLVRAIVNIGTGI